MFHIHVCLLDGSVKMFDFHSCELLESKSSSCLCLTPLSAFPNRVTNIIHLVIGVYRSPQHYLGILHDTLYPGKHQTKAGRSSLHLPLNEVARTREQSSIFFIGHTGSIPRTSIPQSSKKLCLRCVKLWQVTRFIELTRKPRVNFRATLHLGPAPKCVPASSPEECRHEPTERLRSGPRHQIIRSSEWTNVKWHVKRKAKTHTVHK